MDNTSHLDGTIYKIPVNKRCVCHNEPMFEWHIQTIDYEIYKQSFEQCVKGFIDYACRGDL